MEFVRWHRGIFYEFHLCAAFCRVPLAHQAGADIAKFSVVLTHGSDCHSQRFNPLLVVEQRGLGMAGQSHPYRSDCHRMKTFLGRIIAVSDGAGQGVIVSKRGV